MSFFAVDGQPLAPYLQSPAGEDAKAAIESISGKPTAQFLQASPPSTVELAVGAVWREINANGLPVEDWYWSGEFWLSLNRWVSAAIRTGSGNANADFADLTHLNGGEYLYLEGFGINGIQSVSSNSNNNYFRIQLRYRNPTGYTTSYELNTNGVQANQLFDFFVGSEEIIQASFFLHWNWNHVIVGNPGTIRVNMRVYTRRVRPS